MDMTIGSRFGWLYGRGPIAGSDDCDTILVDCAAAVSLPSKGSIVPGWVLTLPRIPALNLARLERSQRQALLAFADELDPKLAAFPGSVWQFEHGPKMPKSSMGCGVDLAHLHSVPLPFDLIQVAMNNAAGHLTWVETSNYADPWAEIGSEEYVIIRHRETKRAIIGQAASAQSQVVRRLIAAELGLVLQWDYKIFPFRDNVQKTLRAFDLR